MYLRFFFLNNLVQTWQLFKTMEHVTSPTALSSLKNKTSSVRCHPELIGNWSELSEPELHQQRRQEHRGVLPGNLGDQGLRFESQTLLPGKVACTPISFCLCTLFKVGGVLAETKVRNTEGPPSRWGLHFAWGNGRAECKARLGVVSLRSLHASIKLQANPPFY